VKGAQSAVGFDFASLGYDHVYWNCGKENQGYAGTAVISKVAAKSHLLTIGNQADTEGRAVTLEFENFYLVNTYVPNSGEGLQFEKKRESWDDDMRKHLHDLQGGSKAGTSGSSKPVIWCGDLNVAINSDDVYDGEINKKRCQSAGFTPGERKRFSLLLDEGLVDAYGKISSTAELRQNGQHYTFWTMRGNNKPANKGWRLDYFVVSPEVIPSLLSVEIRREENFSDHAPLVLNFKK